MANGNAHHESPANGLAITRGRARHRSTSAAGGTHARHHTFIIDSAYPLLAIEINSFCALLHTSTSVFSSYAERRPARKNGVGIGISNTPRPRGRPRQHAEARARAQDNDDGMISRALHAYTNRSAENT